MEASEYVAADTPAAASDTPVEKYSTKYFRGQNRRLAFNWGVFLRYYFVDLCSTFLGPLSGVVAIPVFGLNGAINMAYVPNSVKGLVFFVLFDSLFQFMVVVPLVEVVMVLAGLRPESNYDIYSEGVMVVVALLVMPIPSGAKYAFMHKERFQSEVLGPKVKSHVLYNSDSDTTADAIGQWVRPLKDNIINGELIRALWRSGNPGDGRELQFRFEKNLGGHEVEDQVKESLPLETVLVAVIRRQTGQMQWQFNRKFHPYIYPVALFMVVGVNPMYKAFALGVPAFGSDALEIMASVGTLLWLTMGFMSGSVLRPLISASGHLSRQRRMLRDYNRLILPSIELGSGWSKRMEKKDEDESRDVFGSLSKPVPQVMISRENIKIWARGREALLRFGEVYWLRLSIFIACLLGEVVLLVLVLIIQLILSLLMGTRMEISAFVVIIAGLLLVFVVFFGLVVLEGMHITRSRNLLRTSLLRAARHFPLTPEGKRGDAKEVELELRNVAMEIESEQISHPVKLLGLPLNFTLLESLVGAIIGMMLVFYQVSTTV